MKKLGQEILLSVIVKHLNIPKGFPVVQFVFFSVILSCLLSVLNAITGVFYIVNTDEASGTL